MEFIHNIRIITSIYLRGNMNIGTITDFHCFVFDQMTLLELCGLSGIIGD